MNYMYDEFWLKRWRQKEREIANGAAKEKQDCTNLRVEIDFAKCQATNFVVGRLTTETA